MGRRWRRVLQARAALAPRGSGHILLRHTCCLDETAKPAAKRQPSKEVLAFWGLPAYVAHCMGSQHMALARAWCNAKQSRAGNGRRGLVHAVRAASAAANRQALTSYMHTAVQPRNATQASVAGPGAAAPAAACGAAARAPGALAGCIVGPGSTPAVSVVDSQPAAARASEHAPAGPAAAAVAPKTSNPAQGVGPGAAGPPAAEQGEGAEGEARGAGGSLGASASPDLDPALGGLAPAAAGASGEKCSRRIFPGRRQAHG